jgi:hypothetical protein
LSQRSLPARSNFTSVSSPVPVTRTGLAISPQAELLDQGAIPLEIALLQVLQEPPAAADQLEQPRRE